jgi:hypothetical protein
MSRVKSILIFAIFISLAVGATQARYSGGSGEPNDPYRIANAEDLNDIGNYEEDWSKNFILVNDVNLAQYTGSQFKVIGRFARWSPTDKPFTGVFDGNNHKVRNFTWASTGRSYIGLFGFAGGQIKNLGMENVDVNAVNRGIVGALVGYSGGIIMDCYSTGSVSGMSAVGGLVGTNIGRLTNCYSTGHVTGNDRVGGLVGYNRAYSSYALVTNCYSTGSVDGNEIVGGLAGENTQPFARIRNCYSTGNVTGNDRVGGLLGFNYHGGTITNCYSSGSISAYVAVGGLVGNKDSMSIVVNSFWDTQTSGKSTSAGGVGKTTAEMKTMSTFTDVGWDFVEIWGIGENQTYPFLQTEPASDSNHDKKVDLLDLAILASHWLEGR